MEALWWFGNILTDFCNLRPRSNVVLHMRRTLRVVSIWSLRSLEKTLSNRCDHMKSTLQRSLWNAVIAEVWFPYDHNDCWTFFSSVCSDRRDHVETSRKATGWAKAIVFANLHKVRYMLSSTFDLDLTK